MRDACYACRRADGSYTCDACKASWDADDEAPCQNPQRVEEKQLALGPEYAPPARPPIRVTFDDHVYSPEPGVLITSVHYETDPKTGKRRVIIGFN